MTENHPAKRIHFDGTINLGHVLTASASLIMIVAGYVTLNTAQQEQGRSIVRLETALATAMPRAEVVRIEAMLTGEISKQQAAYNQLNIRTAEDMREVRALLARIDDKLDRKADKPGVVR